MAKCTCNNKRVRKNLDEALYKENMNISMAIVAIAWGKN